MKARTLVSTILVCVAPTILACRSASSLSEKTIKSEKSGGMTITISSPTGEVKKGENELTLSFADSSGKLVDVGAASLTFHMPAMGSMAEMNDKATLLTTGVAGKYRAKVDIEMATTWEAIVVYQGAQGTGQVRMTVNVK
jgi:YtkA-like protein